jgi:hypothetical protein
MPGVKNPSRQGATIAVTHCELNFISISGASVNGYENTHK